MAWTLTNSNKTISMNMQTGQIALDGTMTVHGGVFQVEGAFASVEAGEGRTTSAFSVEGRKTVGFGFVVLAAAGLVSGTVAAPTSVDVEIDVASSLDGALTRYRAVLLPG